MQVSGHIEWTGLVEFFRPSPGQALLRTRPESPAPFLICLGFMRFERRQDPTAHMQHLAPLALDDPSDSQHLAASIGGDENASLLQPLPECLRGQGKTIPDFLAQSLHGGV